MIAVLLAVSLVVLAAAPAPAGVLTNNCVVGPRPAATLLFPYFEVDLANPAGNTTLLSINASRRVDFLGQPITTMARVTLWTEWGVPSVAFNLFLKSGDVQTLNLRDLFATGSAPITGPGADEFTGCSSTIGGFMIDPTTLRLAHTGGKLLGSCLSGGSRGPNVAVGYVTVDTALRCPTSTGGGARTPAEGAAYFTGGTRMVENANFLWGDWIIVTPGDAFAQANPAIGLQYDADAFVAGDYTFYGRYHGFSGVDRLRPLPSQYNARFVQGGAFSGGTDLIVWRDTRDDEAAAISCGGAGVCGAGSCRPSWLPLGEANITARDEQANSTNLGVREIFDLATQRVAIAAVPQPYSFGYLSLNLYRRNAGTSQPAQAWVGVVASAHGQYSVGFEATPTDDLCAVSP